MNPKNYSTYDEIMSQPAAWQAALDIASTTDIRHTKDYEQVVFTGCGSTYYLSLAAAALYQELTGKPARAAPGGELLLNSQTITSQDGRSSLLVAISRSGTTTETVNAAEKFLKTGQGPVLAIINSDSALANLADVSLIISAGQEDSFAQTRSFASMYVASAVFCARMAGREDLLAAMKKLPAVGSRLISEYEGFAKEVGENLNYDRFYFLGSGIRYGLACETSLKMKEMTLTHSEPFHFLEFRHGPMGMVNPETVIIGMLSEVNFRHEQDVLNEMQALGGTIIGLAESKSDINFRSGIPENARGVLYLPVLQLMAYYRSLAKGLNPDRPNNLRAVIELNI